MHRLLAGLVAGLTVLVTGAVVGVAPAPPVDDPPVPSVLVPRPAATSAAPVVVRGPVRGDLRALARPVLGASEPVALLGVPGTTTARVDTGAVRTSVDAALVAGLDLPVVDRVVVRSASGRQERDVVRVRLQVAGEELTLDASVADRSGLSHPVLLGRDALLALDALVDPVAEDGPLAEHVVLPGEVAVEVAGAGEDARVVARVDTGAARSVLDDGLAARLGIEVGARTVVVRSASGRQVRPLADVTLTVDGLARDLAVSVTDRSAMSVPALLGRDALAGVLVDVRAVAP